MKSHSSVPALITDGQDVQLSLDLWGRLVISTDDGRRFVGVEPIRSFPISDPNHWVSFADEQGHEVCCLRTLDGLGPESRRLLEQELALRDFVPLIKRIVQVSGESTPCEWEVDTDHGPTRFTLDTEDEVRLLGPYRIMIVDARKLRYQIPETRALDGRSRRLLDRFV